MYSQLFCSSSKFRVRKQLLKGSLQHFEEYLLGTFSFSHLGNDVEQMRVEEERVLLVRISALNLGERAHLGRETVEEYVRHLLL